MNKHQISLSITCPNIKLSEQDTYADSGSFLEINRIFKLFVFVKKKLKINVPLGVKSHQISLSASVLGMYKAFLMKKSVL